MAKWKAKWLVRSAAVLGAMSLGDGVSGQEAGLVHIATCGSCEFYRAGVPEVNATLSRSGSCGADCSYLYLYNEGLVHIANGTFDGLSGLHTLYLSNNQLSSLPAGLFDGLSGLQHLYLEHNPGVPFACPSNLQSRARATYGCEVDVLVWGISQQGNVTFLFDGYTHVLSRTGSCAEGCPSVTCFGGPCFGGGDGLWPFVNRPLTGIEQIASGTFDGLSGLRDLWLAGNQLFSLPAGLFDGLSGLRFLNLERNQLSSLQVALFDGLSELQGLDLSFNQLSSLPAGLFDGLSGLENFWLSSNQITQHHPDLFRNLTALERFSIYDNPLGCVYGIPEDVEIDRNAIWRGFYETPRCPANCSINTFYYADMDVCLACPEGKYTWGVGAVNCSDIETSSSWSSTSLAPTTPSPTTTTPSPTATIIICPDDTKPFTINGISLCVPPKLYPAENVSHCVFDKTWADVQANRYIFQTGGLGRKMRGDEWKVWVCGAQLPCAIEEQDWVCFTYNEFHDVFVPWGYNRELLIVRKC